MAFNKSHWTSSVLLCSCDNFSLERSLSFATIHLIPVLSCSSGINQVLAASFDPRSRINLFAFWTITIFYVHLSDLTPSQITWPSDVRVHFFFFLTSYDPLWSVGNIIILYKFLIYWLQRSKWFQQLFSFLSKVYWSSNFLLFILNYLLFKSVKSHVKSLAQILAYTKYSINVGFIKVTFTGFDSHSSGCNANTEWVSLLVLSKHTHTHTFSKFASKQSNSNSFLGDSHYPFSPPSTIIILLSASQYYFQYLLNLFFSLTNMLTSFPMESFIIHELFVLNHSIKNSFTKLLWMIIIWAGFCVYFFLK